MISVAFQLNNRKPSEILLDDLKEIHEKTEVRISPIDDEVHRGIHLYNSKKYSIDQIKKLSHKLWLTYTQDSLDRVDNILKELTANLVRVSQFSHKLNEEKRKLNRVRNQINESSHPDDSQDLKEIVSIFNESIKIYNELVDSEKDLRREAWFNFLTRLFFPAATLSSVLFWSLQAYFNWIQDMMLAVFLFLAMLVLVFNLMKSIARDPFGTAK
ncbi:MAG: OadG family protein [Nanoarchaeota archaeon]